MGLFHFLGYGLAAVLVFVGGKMIWTYLQHTTFGQPDYKFPIALSLGVILGILTISVVASLIAPKKEGEAGTH
jgi:tellurite resistance protein TerC